MNFLDILLIIISSAGLLHGVMFAVYLFFFKKKKMLTNYLLAFILVFMAFRIGKSVMLNFGTDLELVFILIGLSFLLLIGPLLKWYFQAMTNPDFTLKRFQLVELLPFFMVFIASFLSLNFNSNDERLIVVFGSVLISIYLHLAVYTFISWRIFQKVKKEYKGKQQTKSHKTIFKWLNLLIIGFVVLWISYFLNILDDSVPYIMGPILYSLVVYFLSFKAYQLKVIDIDGNVFKTNDDFLLYEEISKKIKDEKLYLESTTTLSSVSELLGMTKQKTSEVINQYANQNFNDFINQLRINEAKKKLIAKENEKFTISTIAFDVGFNSLSSFNSAFKKFEGITPSVYRKNKSI